MLTRVEASKIDGVKAISGDTYEGFANKICRFILEVPAEFIQRNDVGPLMAYNVRNKELYEVMLAAKRAYVNTIIDGYANITIEIAEAYIPIAYGDLKKVKGAFLIMKEETQATVQEE